MTGTSDNGTRILKNGEISIWSLKYTQSFFSRSENASSTSPERHPSEKSRFFPKHVCSDTTRDQEHPSLGGILDSC